MRCREVEQKTINMTTAFTACSSHLTLSHNLGPPGPGGNRSRPLYIASTHAPRSRTRRLYIAQEHVRAPLRRPLPAPARFSRSGEAVPQRGAGQALCTQRRACACGGAALATCAEPRSRWACRDTANTHVPQHPSPIAAARSRNAGATPLHNRRSPAGCIGTRYCTHTRRRVNITGACVEFGSAGCDVCNAVADGTQAQAGACPGGEHTPPCA
jgi:hypothetical protein